MAAAYPSASESAPIAVTILRLNSAMIALFRGWESMAWYEGANVEGPACRKSLDTASLLNFLAALPVRRYVDDDCRAAS